ncbi:MAG: hypothetical protein LAKADJCE_00843 [Candidatus Argoarchaeum ethanivorans]|uniref:Uncharacterized protein n=1 Tax=Candidatus Argoarchaeum ethanivorans TaxID=2608793 RepID=A0A811TFT1_9EURY|nr:MAG: hypothetical protein LAKADJCE_00843 [Candidatus Argoarchaeum ethanivorans]
MKEKNEQLNKDNSPRKRYRETYREKAEDIYTYTVTVWHVLNTQLGRNNANTR